MAIHKLILGLLVACGLALSVAVADDAVVDEEINHLISAIGASGCEFVRNGKHYSSKEAEEHIRMKYRRGKRYASSTEHFIERLASQSSMSKKPYWIECEGDPPVKSGDWLKAELERYRAS